MNTIECAFEVDHERRVFIARNDAEGLTVEGGSRDDLREKLRAAVRAKFGGSSNLPGKIVLRDQLGAVVEQIVLAR
jgi:hypothetical protein